MYKLNLESNSMPIISDNSINPPRNQTQQHLFLGTLSAVLFMTNLDISIIGVALPTLSQTFMVDAGAISRILASYLLAIVGLLAVFGSLGDRHGPERVFKFGVALFTIASLLCAVSPGFWFLVSARFLQGIGAAMILATYSALVVLHVPADRRGRAFGIASVWGGAGMVAGPAVGGWLLSYFSWHVLFLINVPIGLVLFLLLARLFKQVEKKEQPQSPFDYAGAVYSFVALSAFVLLMQSGEQGIKLSILSVVAGSLFVLFTLLFIRQERSCSHPLVELSFFRNPAIRTALTTAFLVLVLMDGLFFVFPFFLQNGVGLSTGRTGLLLAYTPFVAMLTGPIGGWLTDKKGSVPINRVALALIVGALALFASYLPATPVWEMTAGFVLFGIGLGMFFTANMVLVMNSASPETVGRLAALSALNTYLGTMFGINLFAILYSHGNADGSGSGYGMATIAALLLGVGALAFSLKQRQPVVQKNL